MDARSSPPADGYGAEGVTVTTCDLVGVEKIDLVRLVGFGSFSVAERAARQGRNPKTGAAIQIAASRQPKFKAGKAIKDAVN